MPGLGGKNWTFQEEVTSSDVNGFLADQVVMRFANATDRTAGFGGTGEPVLAEGMVSYLDSTNRVDVYDGSAWKPVSAVLQVVQGTTTTEVITNSATYVTTNISASITPSSSSNKVLAIWSTTAGKDTTVFSTVNFALFRGTVAGTNLAVASWFDLDSGSRGGVGFTFLDSPNTTSTQTYTVGMQTPSTSTTGYANYGSTFGQITLMEIAG